MRCSILPLIFLKLRPSKLLFLALLLCFLSALYFVHRLSSSTEKILAKMHRKGLIAGKREFLLEDKPFRILSGAMHYFRIPHEYWRDRLIKLRAAGLNTVETYVPWNLHEENEGEFRFDGMLDIVSYVQLAQELGLFVIVRPSPYICAEWDWGGHPAWLMQDPDMRVRTLYKGYTAAVEAYFKNLLPRLVNLQYTKGGPIIAFAIENEYGSYSDDKAYLAWMRDLLLSSGIVELLFTADGRDELIRGSLQGVVAAVNFQREPELSLKTLREFRPNSPFFVGEFWTGWFDHWREKHLGDRSLSAEDYKRKLEVILEEGGSVNLYMFHGGSNFGFLNGANSGDYNKTGHLTVHRPTVTSYDYDCLLDEAGNFTTKYHLTRELMTKYNPDFDSTLPIPPAIAAVHYGEKELTAFLPLRDVLDSIVVASSNSLEKPEFMETLLGTVNRSIEHKVIRTQNFGFIAYRADVSVPEATEVKLAFRGELHDRATLIVNGKEVATFEQKFREQPLDETVKVESAKRLEVCLLVENMGRVNYVHRNGNENPEQLTLDREQKGFRGTVTIELRERKIEVQSWSAYSIDFSADFLRKLALSSAWSSISGRTKGSGPAFYWSKFVLGREETVGDTFLTSEGWTKGVALLNGFNLGRYWNVGPQRTLYVPGPWLKRSSENELFLFELGDGPKSIVLQDRHVLA